MTTHVCSIPYTHGRHKDQCCRIRSCFGWSWCYCVTLAFALSFTVTYANRTPIPLCVITALLAALSFVTTGLATSTRMSSDNVISTTVPRLNRLPGHYKVCYIRSGFLRPRLRG